MANTERQVVDLTGIRADGWFEQLGDEVAEMEQLCAVLGTRFVAFSFIANYQIQSIRYDGQAPEQSVVQYSIAGGAEETSTLTEFRERLGAALLNVPPPQVSASEALSPEVVRDLIGMRYLLLAPVFGVHLAELQQQPGQPPAVVLELGGVREEVPLRNLQQILDNAVRSEVARARVSSPFSIDFKKVPLAEEANQRGDHERTIALLGAWPGPLSMFLRTPQGQELGAQEREKLMRGLCALGVAYLKTGSVDWAEDVLRLGIQFGQELPASAALFAVLGRLRVETERYGEAIGLLRRALALGEGPALLPQLARCFAERGRWVAALGCLLQAESAGVDEAELSPLREQVAAGLGDAYSTYQTIGAEDGADSTPA